MKILQRISAIAFLAGAVIYLAAETISAAAWKSPRYNYAQNWISDLGSATKGVFQGRELDSPLHLVMNAGFITQGLLFGVGIVTLSRITKGRSRTVSLVIGLVVTLGYVLVGIFHGSLQAQQDGTLPLHFTGAAFAILGANLLALLLGLHWRKAPAMRRLGTLSIVVGIIGLTAAIVLCLTFNAHVPSGLIERASVYTIVLWQIAVSLKLIQESTAVNAADTLVAVSS